ncbi:hypothetical protein BURKHO8Y_150020 [Burkholderia sp. 8Y]|nr:hypothetical protein BURKHO8Y_150020 [Burkholderia sp. 8Y]
MKPPRRRLMLRALYLAHVLAFAISDKPRLTRPRLLYCSDICCVRAWPHAWQAAGPRSGPPRPRAGPALNYFMFNSGINRRIKLTRFPFVCPFELICGQAARFATASRSVSDLIPILHIRKYNRRQQCKSRHEAVSVNSTYPILYASA